MRTLVIDDSVVFRMAIKQALEEAGLNVVSALSNGQLAIDFLKKGNEVDLITLDMEMPVMDGMATIKEIRKFNTTVPIIVFSSLTTKGAEKTLDALALGANDFVTKEEAGGAKSIDTSLEMIRNSLIPKIEAFERTNRLKKDIKPSVNQGSVSPATNSGELTIKPKLIVMASSTGGPEALRSIFKNLKKSSSNIPILLVQHMPPMFTTKLAEMLNGLCEGYEVVEAKGGEELLPGVCYIAPGDFHMTLTKAMKIKLNQDEKVCFVRPSANVLFNSVAENFSQQVLSIVLTGMGDDGANGVVSLSKNNSYNFYQSQETCVVWGMPAAIDRSGLGKSIPIDHFSEMINSLNNRV